MQKLVGLITLFYLSQSLQVFDSRNMKENHGIYRMNQKARTIDWRDFPSEPSSGPSTVPTIDPSFSPTLRPSVYPTKLPFTVPTQQPLYIPSINPSHIPSVFPSKQPDFKPSNVPSISPSYFPTLQPISRPSDIPTRCPTGHPSLQPFLDPSSRPTSQPIKFPTVHPSVPPSLVPSLQPHRKPSNKPSTQPLYHPSVDPTRQPNIYPTVQPLLFPSCHPSKRPTMRPTEQPRFGPSTLPSQQPVCHPSSDPSSQPSSSPTLQPVFIPSKQPLCKPSMIPSCLPTEQPTSYPSKPSGQPTSQPSRNPASHPTVIPSQLPSRQPSTQPSREPSSKPGIHPTKRPTRNPSSQPRLHPSSQPSQQPYRSPNQAPSSQPSKHPTRQPFKRPTRQPTGQPTRHPTRQPYKQPSRQPSKIPSRSPSAQPSLQPSMQPSMQPTTHPTIQPSKQPVVKPSRQPTKRPTSQPSCRPTKQPSSQPSRNPSKQPSRRPSRLPTSQPTRQPNRRPSKQPTNQPTHQPTGFPSKQPSSQPTRQPSLQPTSKPSKQPSIEPSSMPSKQPIDRPSLQPSIQPSLQPTSQPSTSPSTQPTKQPFSLPSEQPSGVPTIQPSSQPIIKNPTKQPSNQPSIVPTKQPISTPTTQPSCQPFSTPTRQPFMYPSCQPSYQPSRIPTQQPTVQPSAQPSKQPRNQPSMQPSVQPFSHPSAQPSRHPSGQPSRVPTNQPSSQPALRPTSQPSKNPSKQPSQQPSRTPSSRPTKQPRNQPSGQPSRKPTVQPSRIPSVLPTGQPSTQPGREPSRQPSRQPTQQPSSHPTRQPTRQPTAQPYFRPSRKPSFQPSAQPSKTPSVQPSRKPSSQPSKQPTICPSYQPSRQPTRNPSVQPTRIPSTQPTLRPSRQPTIQPSTQPTRQPTRQPSRRPTGQPSRRPSFQPTMQPSKRPSYQPTGHPSIRPSNQPSIEPSQQPSQDPSRSPTSQPVMYPTCRPSMQPTMLPTQQPSSKPTIQPTRQPFHTPSKQPTQQPSKIPTIQPFSYPTHIPSNQPTRHPSAQPFFRPSRKPSTQPSKRPSKQPATRPTKQPSIQPVMHPTMRPSQQPSRQPSSMPSQPSSQPSNQPTTDPTRWTASKVKFDQTIKLENANSSISRLTTQDQDVVVLTVAKVMSIDPLSVRFKSWSESNSNRRKLASSVSRTIYATTSVEVSTLLVPGFDSSDTAGVYSYLAKKMISAVNSGLFTSSMQSFAVMYGSTALSTCTATSVSVSQLSVSTPAKALAPELSEPEVTGIVVGAVFAALLIAVALIYNYTVSNTLAKKLQKRAREIFIGVPKFQKMYLPEHVLKEPTSTSALPNELQSQIEVFSPDIEDGSMRKRPLVLPNNNAKDGIVLVDEVLTIGNFDVPDSFLLRDKLFLHVVDKNRPPQQRFRKAIPPPIVEVKPEVKPEPVWVLEPDPEPEEDHKDAACEDVPLADSASSAATEDNDDANSLVTEVLQNNESDLDGRSGGEQSVDEFGFESDDMIVSTPSQEALLETLRDDIDLTSNILKTEISEEIVPNIILEDFAQEKLPVLSCTNDENSIPLSTESFVVPPASPSPVAAAAEEETSLATADGSAVETVPFVVDNTSYDSDDGAASSVAQLSILPASDPTAVDVIETEPSRSPSIGSLSVSECDSRFDEFEDNENIQTDIGAPVIAPYDLYFDDDDPIIEDKVDVAAEHFAVVAELKFTVAVAEGFAAAMHGTPDSRPQNSPQKSHSTDIMLTDLFGGDERSQNFAMDLATVKEEMLSKSKVQGFTSFKSGLSKKNVQQHGTAASSHQYSDVNRPRTTEMHKVAPTAFHFLDSDAMKSDIISMRYGFAQADDDMVPYTVPSDGLLDSPIPLSGTILPSSHSSSSGGKMESRSGKDSSKHHNEHSGHATRLDVPSSFAEALLPTVVSNEKAEFHEVVSIATTDDVDEPKKPSWFSATDSAEDVYVPGQATTTANSTNTAATKAQKLQAEKERQKALEEEMRIERENERKRREEFQAAKEAMLSQSKVQSVGFGSLKAGLMKKDKRQISTAVSDPSRTTLLVPGDLVEGSLTQSESDFTQPYSDAGIIYINNSRPSTTETVNVTSSEGANSTTIGNTNESYPDEVSKAQLRAFSGLEIKLKPRKIKSRSTNKRPTPIQMKPEDAIADNRHDDVSEYSSLDEGFGTTDAVQDKGVSSPLSSPLFSSLFSSRPSSSGKVHPIDSDAPHVTESEESQPIEAAPTTFNGTSNTSEHLKEADSDERNELDLLALVDEEFDTTITTHKASLNANATKKKLMKQPKQLVVKPRTAKSTAKSFGDHYLADERQDEDGLSATVDTTTNTTTVVAAAVTTTNTYVNPSQTDERHTVTSFVSPSFGRLLPNETVDVDVSVAGALGEEQEAVSNAEEMFPSRRKPKSRRGKRQKLLVEIDP